MCQMRFPEPVHWFAGTTLQINASPAVTTQLQSETLISMHLNRMCFYLVRLQVPIRMTAKGVNTPFCMDGIAQLICAGHVTAMSYGMAHVLCA